MTEEAVSEPTLMLANWGERFVAWLIDVIIIGAILTPLRWLMPSAIWSWENVLPWYVSWVPFVDVGLSSLIHFLYWAFLEGTYGQSIGKMVMRLKVVRMNGDSADLGHAAIESIGKSFLLIIDLIVGWIMYTAKRQRLFSYLANTVVVRTPRRRS